MDKDGFEPKTAHLRPVFARQAELCKALAHAVRLEVLEILGSQAISSAELCDRLELPKANVSQHIQILKDAGLVRVDRTGTSNRLSLTMPGIKEACAIVRGLIVSQLNLERTKQAELHDLLIGSSTFPAKAKTVTRKTPRRDTKRAKQLR